MSEITLTVSENRTLGVEIGEVFFSFLVKVERVAAQKAILL